VTVAPKKEIAEPWAHSAWLLDAVERWADRYWMVRETVTGVTGRIDGVLVPIAFDAGIFKGRHGGWTDKAGIVGVEIKASRADFLRGLREGQFDRYAGNGHESNLAGVFVVTTRAVKTAEIPAGVGHLVCYQTQEDTRGDWRCVCRRVPSFRDAKIDHDTMWRLVFYAVKRAREVEITARRETGEVMERIGRMAGEKVFAYLNRELSGTKGE
jgi:hypothetical protein